MRRRNGWRLSSFVLAALVMLWAAPAMAQDDGGGEMTFGTDEVEPVEEVAPVGKFLEEGIKHYDNKRYYQASLMFHKVLVETDMSADKFRPKAEYEMAKTLYRLGIYQGALNYFDQIIKDGAEHPYHEATLSWLILLSRKLPGDPQLLERIGKYAELFPDRVPEKFRDELAYLLGRYFYEQADLDSALEHLKFVSKRSEYFPKAKMLEGITYVRKYEAKPAAAAFKQVLAYTTEEDPDEGDELWELEQLALMSMARMFYSVGQYEKSIKYYDFIGQDSPYWLDALFEESWAYYQVDRFNKALGNLHTLNAPFFNDEYFPEAMILTSVVFFTNCRYERVRYTIEEEFEQIYPPLKEELQGYLDQYQDPTEFYEFLVQINEGGGDFDPRLSQILDAALTDKTLKRTIAYIEELDRELKLVEDAKPSWRDSDLGKTLFQDLTVSKSFALGDAGNLARSRLERVVRELNDLIKQGKKILVETAKAETNALDQRLRDEQYQAKPKSAANIEVDEEHIYWSFEGEYWRDELGYYLYNISSQCGR